MSERPSVVDGALFEPDGLPEQDGGSALPDGPPGTEAFLRAVFDIGERELRTYEALGRAGEATTAGLADRLDRDRSNVSRSLSRLRAAGFVTRRRRILESGGHVYQYTARPPDAVLRTVEESLREWTATGYDRLAARLLGDGTE